MRQQSSTLQDYHASGQWFFLPVAHTRLVRLASGPKCSRRRYDVWCRVWRSIARLVDWVSNPEGESEDRNVELGESMQCNRHSTAGGAFEVLHR
jgi:hypothetical protein